MLYKSVFLPWLILIFNESEIIASTIHVPDDYSTVQEACQYSQAGDTIIVNGGQYNENLKITHPLMLIGSNKDSTIITGSDSLPTINIETNNVILQDLFIRGRALENTNAEKGVFIFNSGNITITNVDIVGGASSVGPRNYPKQNGNIALDVLHSSNISVSNSHIWGGSGRGYDGRGSYGVYMDDVSNILIINSSISGGGGGGVDWTVSIPQKYGGDAISINNSAFCNVQILNSSLKGGHGLQFFLYDCGIDGGHALDINNSSHIFINKTTLTGGNGEFSYGIGGDGIHIVTGSDISIDSSIVSGGLGGRPSPWDIGPTTAGAIGGKGVSIENSSNSQIIFSASVIRGGDGSKGGGPEPGSSGNTGLWIDQSTEIVIKNTEIYGGNGGNANGTQVDTREGGIGGDGITIKNSSNISINNFQNTRKIIAGNGGMGSSSASFSLDGGRGGNGLNFENSSNISIENYDIYGGNGGYAVYLPPEYLANYGIGGNGLLISDCNEITISYSNIYGGMSDTSAINCSLGGNGIRAINFSNVEIKSTFSIGGSGHPNGTAYSIDSTSKITRLSNSCPQDFFIIEFPHHQIEHNKAITFEWHPAYDPDQDILQYTIEIDTNSTINATIFSFTTFDTFFTLTQPLAMDVTYYWQVKSNDFWGGISFSNVGYFNIINNNPHAFSIYRFPDNEVQNQNELVFKWENNGDPEGDSLLYTLEIANDSLFINVIYSFTTRDTFYVFTKKLEFAIKYYWRIKAEDYFGGIRYSDVGSLVFIVTKYELFQNYPNPFNNSTNIKFLIPSKVLVNIIIFDILGKEVQMLTNKIYNPGQYIYNYKTDELPSGLYFYKMEAGNKFIEIKKMLIIK